MLAVMLLSQHRVSSSKTVRPRAPCGARCIGHAIRTWSAVCSEAPHSQFGEGARPHLCIDEWNRPTPVRRRCLNQMLAVMLLSQHRVSSSKTVRPRAPCGARCIGHAIRTWSAVCSEAPHSQFGEGARPHLCIDEWNRPTPVRRRLSLTQAARGKPIPTGLAPVPGTKARSLEAFPQYSAFHLWFVHSEARIPSLERLFKRFRAAGTNGRLDLSLTWRVFEDPLKRPYKI